MKKSNINNWGGNGDKENLDRGGDIDFGSIDI